MARRVGLSRSLKLRWLNQTVELIRQGLTAEQIRDELNNYLSFEIASAINIRKTREILMNVWVYENAYTRQLRPAALALIGRDAAFALAAHWCMLLAAYPVFGELCRLIGNMAEVQEQITLAQLKQKLFDTWGERPTLFYSVDKLMTTLKNFGVLRCDAPGKYQIVPQKVDDPEAVLFLIYTVMLVGGDGYYTLSSIRAPAPLFAFSYRVQKEALMNDRRFALHGMGGELSLTLNP